MNRFFGRVAEHLDGHMYDEHVDRLYTAEEVDAMMSEEDQKQNRRRGRRRR